MSVVTQRPLLSYVPGVAQSLTFAPLGDFPTRVESLSSLVPALAGRDAYVKRDDDSAARYGGNKVRTLEVLFGQALARGAERIYATGAFGSNHAAATVLHAERVGLSSGAVLFPQPPSLAALENFDLVVSHAQHCEILPHWSMLPIGMWRTRRAGRGRFSVMPPGGAVPLGALGYVSAALELAEQIARGEMPEPRSIVVGVGSTCTSAGLLVGLRLARHLGIAFRTRIPELVAVRVSPWPVTSPVRIAHLARRTATLLARLSGDARHAFSFAELRAGLLLDPRFIGAGYGRVSPDGLAAIDLLGAPGGLLLDTTYAAKSAAGFLRALHERRGPTLYWATKSSRPLPTVDPERLRELPEAAQRWRLRC